MVEKDSEISRFEASGSFGIEVDGWFWVLRGFPEILKLFLIPEDNKTIFDQVSSRFQTSFVEKSFVELQRFSIRLTEFSRVSLDFS
jgi:hypothetical protein